MIEKAKYELDLILESCAIDTEEYNMQVEINNNILEIVKLFASQGHSGFTASYSIPIINKLLRQSFIMPLTGDDNEWEEVSDALFQNKRESTIFKENGRAYYLDGKVFSRDKGKPGSWFTNSNSKIEIKFPLKQLPKTEYIILNKVNE